jgi:hypothetical protein
MDITRCPKCTKRLMAMTDRTGRTELRCLKCDKASPRKTAAPVMGGTSGRDSGDTQRR